MDGTSKPLPPPAERSRRPRLLSSPPGRRSASPGSAGGRRIPAARSLLLAVALIVGVAAAIVGTAVPASAAVTAAVIGTTLEINLGSANDVATFMGSGNYQGTVSGTGFNGGNPTSVSGYLNIEVNFNNCSGCAPPQVTVTDPFDVQITDANGQAFNYTDPGDGLNPLLNLQPTVTWIGSATPYQVTYGQPDFVPLTSDTNGGISSVTLTNATEPTCSLVPPDGVHINGVSTAATPGCAVSYYVSPNGAYPSLTGQAGITIVPAILSVNAQDASIQYGQAPSLGYTLSGFVNGENATSAGVTGAASCAASPPSTEPGSYPGAITCSPGTLTAVNYDFVQGSSGTETITAAPQSISFTSTPPSPASVGGSYMVTASGGGSGNPVVFSVDGSSTSGACSVSGATVSFTGVGSCVIDANQAGNTDYSAAPQAQQSFTVTVSYAWNGFLQPVDNPATVNTVKAGSAIPVKFSLTGNQGLNIFQTGYPASAAYTCNSSAPTDAIETTVTAGSSSLSYDPASDQYTYVWKTDKAWAGTCRALVVKLADNTVHTADFQFTK